MGFFFVKENDIDLIRKYLEVKRLKEDYGIMLEAFFGKKPNILKIEKAFDSMIKKYGNPLDIVSMVRSKELNDIRVAIADEFGFANVGISIEASYMKNAATMPIVSCFRDPKATKQKKMIEASPKGFRFKKEAGMNILVFIYPGILDQDPTHGTPFTGAELTAILLHEIGHNFTFSVSRTGKVAHFFPAISTFGYILKIATDLMNLPLSMVAYISDFIMALYTPYAKEQNKEVNKQAKKINEQIEKELSKMQKNDPEEYKEYVQEMMDQMDEQRKSSKLTNTIIMRPAYIVLTFLTMAKTIKVNFLNMVLNYVTKPLGYLDERFADNFAAMYGYGPEQISGLNKLVYGSTSSYDQDIPILGHITNLIMLIPNTVCGAFDEHPNIPARYKNITRQLQKELNNPNIDEGTKKIIENQIKASDAIVEEAYKDCIKLSKCSDPSIVPKLFDYISYISLGGDFRHFIMGNTIYKDIDDKVYNGEEKK